MTLDHYLHQYVTEPPHLAGAKVLHAAPRACDSTDILLTLDREHPTADGHICVLAQDVTLSPEPLDVRGDA